MEKYEKKMKIWKCQLKFIFSTWYHHCYVSRILRYVYIVENSISEKCHISHVFVDLGILNSTSGDDSEGIWGQDYKRKITYVKPLVVLDSNRKSNVKLWRNLKKVFFFTKFVIEPGLAAKLRASPVLLF